MTATGRARNQRADTTLADAQAEVRRRIVKALSHRTFATLGIAEYAGQIAAVVQAEFPVAFWMPDRLAPPQTRYLCLRSEPEPAAE